MIARCRYAMKNECRVSYLVLLIADREKEQLVDLKKKDLFEDSGYDACTQQRSLHDLMLFLNNHPYDTCRSLQKLAIHNRLMI